MSKAPHILVVDDDPDTLSLLALTLRRAGYQVTKAISGAAAIAFANENDYDLVLLDLMMPEISGFDVLRALRVSRRDIPTVIMLTAKDTLKDRVEAKELGIVDYITKPTPREILLERIATALNAQRDEVT